jgi:hypothetical protein
VQQGQPDLLVYRAQPDPLDPRARQGRPDCRASRDPLVRQGNREFLDPPDPHQRYPDPLGPRGQQAKHQLCPDPLGHPAQPEPPGQPGQRLSILR